MSLFFNLEILEKEAGSDQLKFLALLEYHYRGVIPTSQRSKYASSKQSLRGSSFILNPEPLFNQDNLNSVYVVQYIKLAGRRPWSMYKFYNTKTLDISLYPDLNLDKIKTNPLLTITNKLIYFKFEETYNGTKIRRNQGQGTKEVS